MPMTLAVNLPVKDLAASTRFFTRLGFALDPRLANETMNGLVVGDDSYVVLVAEARFKTLTTKALSDATTSTEVIVQLRVESRRRVDELVDGALAAGGRVANPPNDQGFLYGRSFEDFDGHLWDVFYIDPAALPEAP